MLSGVNNHQGSSKPSLSIRPHKPRPLAMIRRAESFHHSRSLGDFDHLTRDESPIPDNNQTMNRDPRSLHGHPMEHGDPLEKSKRLHKSKSMEFLKAKLLSRKSSTKLVIGTKKPLYCSDRMIQICLKGFEIGDCSDIIRKVYSHSHFLRLVTK